MSAAAARRRKQLSARKGADQDLVAEQLQKLLDSSVEMDEPTAYEALQLAQSQVRKKVKTIKFDEASSLAYETSLILLQKGRVSVASQLLTLLVEVLRETHTEDTDDWMTKLATLSNAHDKAMKENPLNEQETLRLHRLQRDWLRSLTNWSSDVGSIKYGRNELHELLSKQSWTLSSLESEADEVMDAQCDAVQHMALAEKPDEIVNYLKTLPDPTEEETKAGHTCPPATRDALLTRTILLLCAVENLRDAHALLHGYLKHVEKRDAKDLAASYTNKEDGKAPSHVIFNSMLLSICRKDTRTGPLFNWLLRSFKKELDRMHRPQVIMSYTTKIGKVYFGIQPPPSMLNMVENMMGMMGGGGGPGAGINPAMMQQMQQMMQQM